MVDFVDDASFSALIVIAVCVGPPLLGYIIGGFNLGFSMIFFSLILLPLVLFFLGLGMFKKHDDIYG
jgi:hypothetical protein